VNWGIIPAGNVTKATSETIGLRNALFYAMTGEPFKGKKAAEMGLVNESVPRKKLKKRTEEVARMLLTKNQVVLRGIKIAMKRMRYMDWDASADYLYAKMGEALFMGASDNRAEAMKAFLDDKSYKPGLQHFKGTKK
jgi:trans-feruloyl-CoA hydratase/vanillin synthase